MGRIDFASLDEVIHGRLRLAIMTYLIANDAADFSELKATLQVTQGNLGAHLQKLEDSGYVRITKRFVGKKPNTRVELTKNGRNAYRDYLDAIERLLGSAGDSKNS